MRHIVILSTGGTIEKVYDEFTGQLVNRGSNIQRMIARLRLPDTNIRIREVFSKDSLHITDDERRQIVSAVREELAASPRPDGVVIIHGTDTLCLTGELLHESLMGAAGGSGAAARPASSPGSSAAVVLTGAWKPFELEHSDAMQNLTEALFACTMLPPGVYVVAHGRSLKFPGVVKDREQGTFVRRP